MISVYDYKQNRDYMINVTTKKFYFQPQKKQFKPLNTLGFGAIGGAFYRFLQRQRPQLYLNDPSQAFKISLIVDQHAPSGQHNQRKQLGTH